MNPLKSPPIIDIEASGFGSLSYPIEVGAILADGSRYCQLIKPAPEWRHWDDSAQALHGISRESLALYGKSVDNVAANLNRFLAGQTVFSDAWVVDFPWLRTLFAAARCEMKFTVSPLEGILSEPQMACWAEVKRNVITALGQKRHRASADAEIIQMTFRKTRLATLGG